jgi:hypothetical protein
MIPEDLLRELERRFPDQCPEPTMTDREVWMAVGATKVVRLLRSYFNEQQGAVIHKVN